MKSLTAFRDYLVGRMELSRSRGETERVEYFRQAIKFVDEYRQDVARGNV